MKATARVIILKPHPMGWLYLIVICILAIPLFGLGLVAGYFLWKHIRSISYQLSDRGIDTRIGDRTTSISWDSVTDAVAVSRAGRLGHVIIRTEGAEIRLLFTDVVLPGGINGHELASHARNLRPGLPILLITGYASAAPAPDTVAADIPVLRKPFDQAALAAALNELDPPEETR